MTIINDETQRLLFVSGQDNPHQPGQAQPQSDLHQERTSWVNPPIYKSVFIYLYAGSYTENRSVCVSSLTVCVPLSSHGITLWWCWRGRVQPASQLETHWCWNRHRWVHHINTQHKCPHTHRKTRICIWRRSVTMEMIHLLNVIPRVYIFYYFQVTPLTALKFAELSVKAGIPKGVINILPGSGNTNALPFVFFVLDFIRTKKHQRC